MSYTFRPAVRVNTPLIIGIAGATKSGKTYSALRLAQGLANGGPVVMLNAEGARGHQYADKFTYLSCDLVAPYRPFYYTEAIEEAEKLNPGCLIIDSVSHLHDGPGGFLEWHEELIEEAAKKNPNVNRNQFTWSAWIKPKAAINELRYVMLSLNCPLILCMRAKEKQKIVTGKAPIDLGWQPIVSDDISFETIFTLMLTPGCKGIPSSEYSQMREPFDKIVPMNRPIDEELGRRLTEWATGSTEGAPHAAHMGTDLTADTTAGAPSPNFQDYVTKIRLSESIRECSQVMNDALGDSSLSREELLDIQGKGKRKIQEFSKK